MTESTERKLAQLRKVLAFIRKTDMTMLALDDSFDWMDWANRANKLVQNASQLSEEQLTELDQVLSQVEPQIKDLDMQDDE
jgi:hypothetical protein